VRAHEARDDAHHHARFDALALPQVGRAFARADPRSHGWAFVVVEPQGHVDVAIAVDVDGLHREHERSAILREEKSHAATIAVATRHSQARVVGPPPATCGRESR